MVGTLSLQNFLSAKKLLPPQKKNHSEKQTSFLTLLSIQCDYRFLSITRMIAILKTGTKNGNMLLADLRKNTVIGEK